MRIQIEKIPFGISDTITSVELEWGSKPFYGDNVTLNILAFNESGNLVQEKPICMTTEEYYAMGETKDERADAILAANCIVKIESDIFEEKT